MTAALEDLTVELDDADLVRALEFQPLEGLVREVVPLSEQDLKVLSVVGPAHSQPQIRHIRAYHHMVALKLAAGERPFQICAALGLTPQTITKLQDSPQFADLVEAYRSKIIDNTVQHVELMGLVSVEALTALHERLTGDERDEVPLELLRRLAETFVDRIGHSPVRRSESIAVHRVELDAKQIDRIKQLHSESRRLPVATTIDAEYSIHEKDSESSGAERSATNVFKSARSDEDDSGSGGGAGV